MRSKEIICSLIIAATLSSCGKEMDEGLLQICDRLSHAEIIEDGEEECIFSGVWDYQGAIYTVCECCNCNKLAFIVGCDGSQLCPTEDGGQDQACRDRFYQDAALLFTVRDSL